MKKTFLFAMGALLGGALLFTSCGKDDKEDDPKPEPEVEVDIRDAAIGNYSGTTTYYWATDEGMIEDEETFGKPNSITGSVEKDSEQSNAIRLAFDGDVFYGNKIAEASNGFTFDIETQTIEDVKVTGYNVASLGTAEYNGLFLSEDSKTLTFGIKISVEDFIDLFFDEEDEDSWIVALAVAAYADEEGIEWVVVEYDMTKR